MAILKRQWDFEEEANEELLKEIEETTLQTKAAIEKIINVRLSLTRPKYGPTRFSHIKYKPSGADERMIRVMDMAVDPLDPPKFKHKKIPRVSGSPPLPLMHSPPRPLSLKDQQDWKIPPCISNWKNPKGYSIPLDKRLLADVRGIQDVGINENFAKVLESLYVAEQMAGEAVAKRAKVREEIMMRENERKNGELRDLAQKARLERINESVIDGDVMRETGEGLERLEREYIRKEREKERRLETKDGAMRLRKKSKISRDRDRNMSEKVALGMASVGVVRGGEVTYDQRLFNQGKGMDSGFATDYQYNVYDKGLFTAQPTLSTLYRPKKDAFGDETDRFKPDKAFVGTYEKTGPRERPVEFEAVVKEADIFGLDLFFREVNKAMDKFGNGGL